MKVRYTIPAGQMVSFGLVRIDAKGNEQVIIHDWCTLAASRNEKAEGQLKIDVLNQMMSNANPGQQIVHTLDMNLVVQTATGMRQVRGFSMEGNWSFEPLVQWPSFAGTGEFRLKAAREIPRNWDGAAEDIGRLEIVLKHQVNAHPEEMESMESGGLRPSSK